MRKVISIICCWLDHQGSQESASSVANFVKGSNNFEIILVDSSKDGNLNRYFRGHKVDLKHHKRPPSSIYDAFNFGVSVCKSKMFFFLHQGDRINDAFSAREFLFALSEVDLDNTVICFNYYIELYEGIFAKRVNRSFIPIVGRMPIHVGVICSKSLWERVDGFDERYKISSDYDFLLKSFYAGSFFILNESVLGEMRAGGVSRKKKLLALKEDFAILYKYFGVLSVFITPLKKLRFLSWYIAAYLGIRFKNFWRKKFS